MVTSKQLLLTGFPTGEPCQAALAKLQVGIPWAAEDRTLVYTWLPANSLSCVLASIYMPGQQLDLVAVYVHSSRLVLWNVFDRVISPHHTAPLMPY
jgi:hypothetical protein